MTVRDDLMPEGFDKDTATIIDSAVGTGGGAAAFTDLTDAPGVIVTNAPLVGNAAGTAVEFATGNSVGRITKTIAYDAAATQNTFGVEAATDENFDEFGAATLSSVASTAIGSAKCELTAGFGANFPVFQVEVSADATTKQVALLIGGGADFIWTGIPTSDPAVANALWNDAGALKISAG